MHAVPHLLLAVVWPLGAIAAGVLRGGEARRAAVAVGLAWLASMAVTPLRLSGPALWLMAVDVMLALWLIGMTRKACPPWLVFTAACALLLVVNHIAFAISSQVRDWAFFSTSYVWTTGVLIGLVWAAISPRLEVARPPAPWRDSAG